MSKTRWVPLESNPTVITKFMRQLGVCHPDLQFSDVWSLDLLVMQPAPVLAVIIIFPITAETEKVRSEQAKNTTMQISKSAYFVKQTISNACGTIALIHSILNNSQIPLTPGSFFSELEENGRNLTPEARAKFLETSKNLSKAHASFASSGDTAPPDPNEKIDLHFVAFTNVDGVVYEFDGRKHSPITHGECNSSNFLEKCAAVVKTEFMALVPNSTHFTMITLGPAREGEEIPFPKSTVVAEETDHVESGSSSEAEVPTSTSTGDE